MASTRLPPGPRGLAIPRTLARYSRAPLDAFTELAREYGDVVQFMGPPMRAFLLNDPEEIERVQVQHSWNFEPMRVLIQRRLAPQGVALSEGYLHQYHRQMLDPIYRERHVLANADLIVRSATLTVSGWQEGRVVDVQREMSELAIRTLTGMLFGAEVWRNDEEMAAWFAVGDYVARRSTYPWGVIPEYLPLLPANRRFWGGLRTIKTAVRLRIAERRVSEVEHDDILGLLMAARDPDGRMLTDRQIHDDVITTVFAGASPVGQSLVWIWYLLSQNPQAEAKLHAELDQALGDRVQSVTDLASLNYTHMAIEEALRLYPVSWILGRKALNDYQIDSYTLPAGSIVVLCPYVTQRDERYFAEPQAFAPERWTPDAREARPAFSYYPFSAGSNACLGREWAPTILALTLATLARNWRLRREPGPPPGLDPLFVLRAKGGMPMRPERRSAPSQKPAREESGE